MLPCEPVPEEGDRGGRNRVNHAMSRRVLPGVGVADSQCWVCKYCPYNDSWDSHHAICHVSHHYRRELRKRVPEGKDHGCCHCCVVVVPVEAFFAVVNVIVTLFVLVVCRLSLLLLFFFLLLLLAHR